MRTTLMTIILFGFSTMCIGQTLVSVDTLDNGNVHVVTNEFECVIFCPNNNSYHVGYSETKWMPTDEDVLLCDKIIRNFVNKKERKKAVVVGNSPIIHENFDKYVRQYMGYVDKHGRKILRVRYVWKEFLKDDKFQWLDHQVGGIGGGTYFWQNF